MSLSGRFRLHPSPESKTRRWAGISALARKAAKDILREELTPFSFCRDYSSTENFVPLQETAIHS
jgi:hypothetical protein